MTDFSPKRVNEREIYTCDFSALMSSGATISSAVWTVTVKAGTDATPNAMVSGSASIVGSTVSQMLMGGVAGVYYWPICTATMSDGEIIVLPDIGTGMLSVV